LGGIWGSREFFSDTLTEIAGYKAGVVLTEAELFEMLGKKLAQDEKNQAQKMVLRLESTARQANNTVLDYEFRYCRFQPSKFL